MPPQIIRNQGLLPESDEPDLVLREFILGCIGCIMSVTYHWIGPAAIMKRRVPISFDLIILIVVAI